MRALTITAGGDLAVVDRPEPEPVDDQVVVQVAGAGVNRADLLQRLGLYPAPPDTPVDVPGLEFAGTVAALGPRATGVAVGDRVFGIVGGGAQAEYVVTRASHCAVVPDGLDLVEAGAVPEAFVTAHDALRTQALLAPGERVLVHAVGSGVGTAVVQLAHAFGCTVVGTARTAAKLEYARELGLDHELLASTPLDPAALAREITGACGGVDVTIDLVGGEYVQADVLASAPHGRIVLVGTLAGGYAALPVLVAMSRRLTIVGTVLRSRDAAEKAEATAAFVVEVVPLLADRTVRPVIDAVVPLEDATRAYELLASDTTFGKVVLAVTP